MLKTSVRGKTRFPYPNILVILTDQQRPDTLGCYGSLIGRTPNIDRIAGSGTRFENAFTTFPVCTPARSSLWTGLYPHSTGIEENVTQVENRLYRVKPKPAILFEEIKKQGYLTGYFGKWHLGIGDPGFFDRWSGFNSTGGHWIDGRQSFQGGTYIPEKQTDELVEFIHWCGHNAQPFLAVISFYTPHNPYSAPERFFQRYRGRVPFAGYYAAVEALDFNIGRILDVLEQIDIVSNTLMIFTSDHGETFGYRGVPHKFVCTDDAIRVPFIVAWPGHVQTGAVRRGFIGAQDLMPTVLDCAGIDAPAGLHGRSLRPWFQGTPDVWREAYYVENRTFRERLPQRALRTPGHKLVLDHGGNHQLFDLTDDPEEELNIFGAPKADKHCRFNHYPDQSSRIRKLAEKMRCEAEILDDHFGITLTDNILK